MRAELCVCLCPRTAQRTIMKAQR